MDSRGFPVLLLCSVCDTLYAEHVEWEVTVVPTRKKTKRKLQHTIVFLSVILLLAVSLLIFLQWRQAHPEPEILNGWTDTENGRCYYENGTAHTGWLDTEEGQYYIDASGRMLTGWLNTEAGRYFFDDAGLLQTGWLNAEEGVYYLDETGRMLTGWLQTEESRYYFGEDGLLYTGWLDTEAGRMYLDGGSPRTGWLYLSGESYYLTEAGCLYTGWLTLDGQRYYLREDGSMAVGCVVIDGVNNFFTSTGKYVVVVNPWNAVPEDYQLNLVELEGFEVAAECRDDLLAMMEACRAAGHVCVLNSTYRSISLQQILWDNRYYNYIDKGYSPEEAHALTGQVVAYPGTSEHHLGLAVDITGTDEMYAWLSEHSWEYGFHMRYPEDKIDITGIIYEPWHFRYVGKELAKELYDLGLTVEEYMDMLTK